MWDGRDFVSIGATGVAEGPPDPAGLHCYHSGPGGAIDARSTRGSG